MTRFFLTLFVSFALGCGSTPKPKPAPVVEPTPAPTPQSFESIGVHTAISTIDFESTYALVRSTVITRPNTTIVAEIDHQKNAKSKGIELEPTRVILFDNPDHTIPLLTANPVAGLDRPQRIIVFERDTITYVATDMSEYVGKRHNVTDVPELSKSDLKLDVVGTEKKSAFTPENGQGVTIVPSNKSVDETYATFKQAVTQNENLNVMAEYDFAARSKAKIKPAKLLVFGNPKLGTPLMKKSPVLALDLPQKVLFFTADDGTTAIAYNTPDYLVERHGVSLPEVTKKIAGALNALSQKSAK